MPIPIAAQIALASLVASQGKGAANQRGAAAQQGLAGAQPPPFQGVAPGGPQGPFSAGGLTGSSRGVDPRQRLMALGDLLTGSQ